MKKIFIILLILLIVIIAPFMIFISDYKQQKGEIKKFNLEFEQYSESKVKGIDIASLMNSAVDNNEKHGIEKNEQGIYIDDDKYCVRVEIVMNSITDETKVITYAMENIYSLGIDRFVKNFNLLEFKCNNIVYNSVGRVSKIVFELED